MTGFPSIDKPWQKYYKQEDLEAPLPQCKFSDYVWNVNQHGLSDYALEYLGTKITYGSFFHQIEQTAKGFLSLGVKQGDIVTVFSVNTPETLFTVFALNKIGAVPCMEYVTESEKEAIEAVQNCNSSVVVILDVLMSRFCGIGAQPSIEHVVVLPLARSLPAVKKIAFRLKAKVVHCAKEISYARLIESGINTPLTESPYQKDSPAVIVHSGGTTGVPKGVVLSDDNINYVTWAFLVGGNDGKRGDIFYTCIPMFHAFGFVAGAMMPLVNEQTLALAVKYDEQSFIQNYKRLKPNHTMSSSTYLPSLIADPEIQNMDLSFYKTMGMGGTPISHATEIALCDFMEAHHSIARASLGYGMSEVASAACTELNRYYGKTGSVGIPLCKVNIKAVDTETLEEKPYNKEGELYISTPGLMLHYLNNEAETNATIFTDEKGVRWIKTGDLGYIDEDGFVFITGKLKRIYTTRTDAKGAIFHIFPDFIADTICNVPSVRDCVVVCLSHPVLKSIPIAFVLPESSDSEKIPAEVSAYCESKLPEHSRPKAVYTIDSIPKTAVGKPDYKQLETVAAQRFPID